MPEITLTVFVDFTTTDIRGQISRVRRQVNEEAYDVRKDFWRPLRKRIQAAHENGEPIGSIEDVLLETADKKKHNSYPAAIEGYVGFIGHRKVEYFEPPHADWVHDALVVRVNPELGLVIRDVPYAIKLWFSKRELSKRRCDVTLGLMEEALRPHLEPEVQVAVLDVQRSTLYHPTVQIADMDVLLAGVASSFLEMYRRMSRHSTE